MTRLPANPIAIAAGQLGAAAVLSLALVPIDGGRISTATPATVLAVIVLGVAGTGLAYVLNYALLNAEGPTATSLVAYLIPVVAAVLGVLVLGDQLPPFAGAGARASQAMSDEVGLIESSLVLAGQIHWA